MGRTCLHKRAKISLSEWVFSFRTERWSSGAPQNGGASLANRSSIRPTGTRWSRKKNNPHLASLVLIFVECFLGRHVKFIRWKLIPLLPANKKYTEKFEVWSQSFPFNACLTNKFTFIPECRRHFALMIRMRVWTQPKEVSVRCPPISFKIGRN